MGKNFWLDLTIVSDVKLYNKERMKVIRSHIMKQNGDFKEGISQT